MFEQAGSRELAVLRDVADQDDGYPRGLGETDEMVSRKLAAALSHDLVPIVCVGETLAEYESSSTTTVVTRQINLGLAGIPEQHATRIVIAYEPVWAIGTGKASSRENAESGIREVIRPALAALLARTLPRLSGCCTEDRLAQPTQRSSSQALRLTVHWSAVQA